MSAPMMRFLIRLTTTLWNYSKGGIELGREMFNYTSTNVSYDKGADIRAAFLTNAGGDESDTKNKKKGVAISTLILD